MGGLSRLGILAVSGALTAVGASAISSVTNRISEDIEAKMKREAADKGEEYRPNSDLLLNLDGGVRLGMLGTALIGVPVAIGAALLKKPDIAMGVLGASTALAGTSILSGRVSEIGRPESIKKNLVSMGSTLNAAIHAALPSSNPRFGAHTPYRFAKDTIGTGKRPSPEQIRNAPLALKPGEANMDEARKKAQETLDRIDWSKPEIIIWVPGTGAHHMAPEFEDGVKNHIGDRASLTYMDYPASMDFGSSVATGMETLRLVLAGIAEKGGDTPVSLAGHSQGAWVISDAMADPAIYDMVERATIFGNPGMAQKHFTDRRDPKVVEINDSGDPITFPVTLKEDFLSGIHELENGNKWGGGTTLAKVAVRNPGQVSYLLAKYLQPSRWGGQNDPHHYEELFDDAAKWIGEPGALRAKVEETKKLEINDPKQQEAIAAYLSSRTVIPNSAPTSVIDSLGALPAAGAMPAAPSR